MEPVEIRYIKKVTLPLLIIMQLASLGAICYLFFDEDDSLLYKLIWGLIALSFGIGVFIALLKLLKNKPFIILTSEFIILDDKPILRSQILGWEITKDQEDGAHLHIQTIKEKNTLCLNYLEKSPEQIGELMKAYTTL